MSRNNDVLQFKGYGKAATDAKHKIKFLKILSSSNQSQK